MTDPNIEQNIWLQMLPRLDAEAAEIRAKLDLLIGELKRNRTSFTAALQRIAELGGGERSLAIIDFQYPQPDYSVIADGILWVHYKSETSVTGGDEKEAE